jgi:hypothetical protein
VTGACVSHVVGHVFSGCIYLVVEPMHGEICVLILCLFCVCVF